MAKSRSATLTRPPPNASPNKLLAALPEADYRRISSSLTTVPFPFKHVLHKDGGKIDAVYFPSGGVCSITNVMSDGRMVEVATIGNEGVVGLTVFFGGDVSVGEAFVQVPNGDAQAMPLDAFRRELDRRGAFFALIGRYGQALQALIMQSAACFSMHSVEERCCRWLLMTHDRVDAGSLSAHTRISQLHAWRSTPNGEFSAGNTGESRSDSQRHEENHRDEPQGPGKNVVRVLSGHQEHVRPSIAAATLSR